MSGPPAGVRRHTADKQAKEAQGQLINQLFRNYANQAAGKSFEQVFLYRARMLGLLAIENGQKVRWLRGGKMVAEKCQLDFTVLNEAKQAAFLDCKATKGESMPYSAFDPRQVSLACQYAQRGFAAGFVVHFRALGLVSFFSAAALQSVGPRRSAKPADPNLLGPLESFDLHRVFTSALT